MKSKIVLSLMLAFAFLACQNNIKKIEETKKECDILLVDFYSEGCYPCIKLFPIIDEIQIEYPNIKILKIDVNSDEETYKEYNINLVPTVLIFYKGNIAVRIVGFHEKYNYTKYIDRMLNSKSSVFRFVHK